MKSRTLITIAVIVGVIALAGFGYTRWKTTNKPKVKLGRTTVAKIDDISVKVTEKGTLEPTLRVDVKSRAAGRLQRILVREGQVVRQGELLAIVDPTEIERQVAGIRAQLAASQASEKQAEENYKLAVVQNKLAVRRAEVALSNANASLREARIAYQSAQAQYAQAAAPARRPELEQQRVTLARAEAQVKDTQRTLDRRRSLLEKGFISQQDVDAAQLQVTLAEADVRSQQQQLALLQEGPRQEIIRVAKVAVDAAKERVHTAEIGVESAQVALVTEKANAAQAQLRRRDVESAHANVTQIENQLAQQTIQLSETRIVSPTSGEVIGKYLEEGELVASATAGFAQGAALATIADLSKMQVRVNVNEVDVARLQIGYPVEIRVDSIPNQVFTGRVTSIASASLSQNQSGSSSSNSNANQTGVVRFEVKITVANPDRRLRPGMTATTDIILSRHEDVVLLPTEAIRPDGKVTVITGTGEAIQREERTVKTGLKNDVSIEILSGLKDGEKVEIPKIDAKDRRTINFNGNN